MVSLADAFRAVGEVSSRYVAWEARNPGEFKSNFPGYTVGDAGAAVLLAPATDERGIFFRQFHSISAHWELMTVLAGGSMYPRDHERTYLRTHGTRLKEAFIDLGVPILQRALRDTGRAIDQIESLIDMFSR